MLSNDATARSPSISILFDSVSLLSVALYFSKHVRYWIKIGARNCQLSPLIRTSFLCIAEPCVDEMRLHDFWSLCSAVLLCTPAANGQTITVTTHISACAATYSTVTVPSTVTVQPTPFTDAMANSGTPFVIRLQQVDTSGYPDQSSAPYWLTANGNTTTNVGSATVYEIVDGQLMTYIDGYLVSTNNGVVDQIFSASSSTAGSIKTFFTVNNRMLNWTNAVFTNGTAQFYKLPPGLLQNAQILAKLIGPMEPQRSWSPVILYIDPGKLGARIVCPTADEIKFRQSLH